MDCLWGGKGHQILTEYKAVLALQPQIKFLLANILLHTVCSIGKFHFCYFANNVSSWQNHRLSACPLLYLISLLLCCKSPFFCVKFSSILFMQDANIFRISLLQTCKTLHNLNKIIFYLFVLLIIPSIFFCHKSRFVYIQCAVCYS